MASLLASRAPAITRRVRIAPVYRVCSFSTAKPFHLDLGARDPETREKVLESNADVRVKNTPVWRIAWRKKGRGTLSATARSLRSDDRSYSEPEVVLQELITQGRADIGTISVLVKEAYFQALQLPEHDPGMKRFDHVASTVLVYIWKEQKMWSDAVFYYPKLMAQLCWFAVWERVEGIIVDWIKTPDRSLPPNAGAFNSEAQAEKFWRGNLLTSLIMAYNKCDRTHNSSLRCFLSVMDWTASQLNDRKAGRIPAGSVIQISAYTGCATIAGSISRHPSTQADPALYDRFLHFYRRLHRTAGKANAASLELYYLDIAALTCAHPTEPHYREALEYLQKFWKEDVAATYPRNTTFKPNVKRVMQMALPLAKSAGHDEDSKWLEEKYRSIFGNEEADRFWQERAMLKR